MKEIRRLDARLTELFRLRGKRFLSFWKLVAAKGMWLFVPLWLFIAGMGWMVWWRPLLPLILSYVSLLIVQAIVKRERPNFEKLSGYTMWIRTYSFPSGHSTESVVLALSLLFYPVYPHAVVFAAFFSFSFILCFSVMYSRVVVGVHYVSDVLAGLCLGALYAIAFM